MALIDIQTRIVTDSAILSDFMHPSIKIDPKDPKKLINTINQSKEKVLAAVKPAGVETFYDPETGLFGYYEPGTKTKVIVTSIDLPLFGNVYKDGEWKSAAGKAIRAYILSNNLASSVAAKKKFDLKKTISNMVKSTSSKFNAATGTFTSKNFYNAIGGFVNEQAKVLTPTFKEHMSEAVATIESQCKNIETIWTGDNKNIDKSGKKVDENGNIIQSLDKAAEEIDQKNSTTDKNIINTQEALQVLQERLAAAKAANSGSSSKQKAKALSLSPQTDKDLINKLIIEQKEDIINKACNAALIKIKKDFIYPSEDDLIVINDESCQKTLMEKMNKCVINDVLNSTFTMNELLLSFLTKMEYIPDEIFIGIDNIVATEIRKALQDDIDASPLPYKEEIISSPGSTSGSVNHTVTVIPTNSEDKNIYENLAKLLISILDTSYTTDGEELLNRDDYTDNNLYAKWIEEIPINTETYTYEMPEIIVGHIVFTPYNSESKINFRTVYNWEQEGKVSINYVTGTVNIVSTGKNIGYITEYSRGYNEKEIIEDILNGEIEANANNLSYKSLLINSKTGLSEEFDAQGRRKNEDKPPKIRISGAETLMDDEQQYEDNMFNRALSGCYGSTAVLDKENEIAKTGYKDLLRDWMSETEFNTNPQHSLANGF